MGVSRGGGVRGCAFGGADRLQPDVPWRALFQRRHRRIRRGRGMAKRPDHGSGDDPSWWQARGQEAPKPNFVELRLAEVGITRARLMRTSENSASTHSGE